MEGSDGYNQKKRNKVFMPSFFFFFVRCAMCFFFGVDSWRIVSTIIAIHRCVCVSVFFFWRIHAHMQEGELSTQNKNIGVDVCPISKAK